MWSDLLTVENVLLLSSFLHDHYNNVDPCNVNALCCAILWMHMQQRLYIFNAVAIGLE